MKNLKTSLYLLFILVIFTGCNVSFESLLNNRKKTISNEYVDYTDFIDKKIFKTLNNELSESDKILLIRKYNYVDYGDLKGVLFDITNGKSFYFKTGEGNFSKELIIDRSINSREIDFYNFVRDNILKGDYEYVRELSDKSNFSHQYSILVDVINLSSEKIETYSFNEFFLK